MQQAPFRLAQCIRTAFRSSRPPNRLAPPLVEFRASRALHTWTWLRKPLEPQPRFYTNGPNQPRKQQQNPELGDTHTETLQRAESEAPAEPLPTSSSSPKPSPKPQNDSAAFNDLPSRIASRRTELTKHLSHIMDNVQANIFVASRRLNDLTGYSGIEALKRDIEAQEENVQASRRAVKEARGIYAAAVATRSTTQREVNDLLQRKHMWSPQDLERFTGLYRSDHANEQAEVKAQDELGRLERDAEEASSRLTRTILARYHEEQIWSDKIRQMSTWGTWGLMGVNVLLFLIFQVAIEPWRRKRLVKGFEEKVKEAMEKEGNVVVTTEPLVSPQRADVPPSTSTASVPKVVAVVAEAPSAVPAAINAAKSQVEETIETMEGAEIAQETGQVDTAEPLLLSKDLVAPADPELPPSTPESSPSSSAPAPPAAAAAAAAPLSTSWSAYYAYYEEAFRELFSDEKKLLVTQRQLTNVALEGACFGIALGGTILVLLRPR